MEAQDGTIRGISETIWRLQTCLEAGGVVFIAPEGPMGPGVRLARPFGALRTPSRAADGPLRVRGNHLARPTPCIYMTEHHGRSAKAGC